MTVHVQVYLTSNRLHQILWGGAQRLVYQHCELHSRDSFRFIADCAVDDRLTSLQTVQHHHTVVETHFGLFSLVPGQLPMFPACTSLVKRPC